MAYGSFVFKAFKKTFYNDGYDLTSGIKIYIQLVNSTFYSGTIPTTARDNDSLNWNTDSSSWVVGTAKKLSNVSVVQIGNATTGYGYKYTATDASWSEDITAYGAVVYDQNGVPICFIDFGQTSGLTSVSGSFVVPLSNGFLQTP